MKTAWNAVREAVTIVALVGVAAATGFGLASGVHEPAARFLAAECRGFDALVAADAASTQCTGEAAPAALLK